VNKIWWKSMLVAVVLIMVLTGCGTVAAVSVPVTQLVASAATSTPAPGVYETAPLHSSSQVLPALEDALTQIYQDVSPSVVYIEVVHKVAVSNGTLPGFPFFGFPAPQGQTPSEQYQHASGSGFVWDTNGHIVTNNHVIDGADKINVTFPDGTTVPATVVGADPNSDLAVIKVDVSAAELKPVVVGDSTAVRVGQLAVAIGNPFGLDNTMTVGFISALDRSLPSTGRRTGMGTYAIPDIIQTDAAINPGNSGGVLLSEKGELIGVTAAIASPVRASAGIGFAVPSAIVQRVVPVLIEKGHYSYAWLGVSGTTLAPQLADAMKLDSQQRGAMIVQVIPNGPADKAGIRGSSRKVTIEGADVLVGGDVVIAIDGTQVDSFDDLSGYLVRDTEAGQKVVLTILRDGKQQELTVTLGERPNTGNESGKATSQGTSQQAWLGIKAVGLSPKLAAVMGLSEEQQGMLIEQVVADSPADQAGLRGSYKPATVDGKLVLVGGDVIVGWGDQAVTGSQDLERFLADAQPGQHVKLTVLRSGERVSVDVTLGSVAGQ